MNLMNILLGVVIGWLIFSPSKEAKVLNRKICDYSKQAIEKIKENL